MSSKCGLHVWARHFIEQFLCVIEATGNTDHLDDGVVGWVGSGKLRVGDITGNTVLFSLFSCRRSGKRKGRKEERK